MGIHLYPGDEERPVCCTCLSSDRRRVFFVTGGDCDTRQCHHCQQNVPLNNHEQDTWPKADQLWWTACGGHADLAPQMRAWVDTLIAAPDVTEEQAAWCVMRLTNRVQPDALPLALKAVDTFMKVRAVETAKKAKADAEAEAATGNWVGTISTKQSDLGLLRCEAIIKMPENQAHPEWGERYLIKWTDPDGNELVWFTGISKFDPEIGQEYDVVGRIKAHTVYNGRKQTQVTHVKQRKVDADGDADAD